MKNQIKGMQGDVQFTTTNLPKGAVKISNRPIALGEHSGHQHCLTGDVELYEFQGRTFAVVGSDGARLQHVHESNFKGYKSTAEQQKADHHSHLLPEGTYEFFIQNAYNPYKKLMEKVID